MCIKVTSRKVAKNKETCANGSILTLDSELDKVCSAHKTNQYNYH